MLPQWYNNLPKDQQDNFKKIVLGSQKVLDRLREICYNTIKSRESTEFGEPDWALREAYRQGYVKAYKEIQRLTTISDNE